MIHYDEDGYVIQEIIKKISQEVNSHVGEFMTSELIIDLKQKALAILRQELKEILGDCYIEEEWDVILSPHFTTGEIVVTIERKNTH